MTSCSTLDTWYCGLEQLSLARFFTVHCFRSSRGAFELFFSSSQPSLKMARVFVNDQGSATKPTFWRGPPLPRSPAVRLPSPRARQPKPPRNEGILGLRSMRQGKSECTIFCFLETDPSHVRRPLNLPSSFGSHLHDVRDP